MFFLVDSCISKFVTEHLRNQGHNVVWLPESGKDPGDESILQMAYEEGRILITADKDFGDLVFVYNMPHPTIIRLVDIPPRTQILLLEKVLKNHSGDLENKVLITANMTRIRIKYPDDKV